MPTNITAEAPTNPEGHAADITILAAQCFFGFVAAALTLHFRRHTDRIDGMLIRLYNACFGTSLEKYEACITHAGKYIFWSHGPVVVSMFALYESSSNDSALHYLLGSAAIFLLWDCAASNDKCDLWTTFLINCHHLGAVIAYVYQATENPVVAHRNTLLFGWLWMIHSFGFFQDVLLPLCGLPKTEGKKYLVMDIVRHGYAAGSVFSAHLFLSGDEQPGLGWNYQTAAFIPMFLGRFIVGGNAVNIEWMRRVECPGVILAILYHITGSCEIAVSCLATVLIGAFTWKLATYSPVPDKYELTPEIQQLLDEQVTEKFDAPHWFESWWKEHETWSESWPLHGAALIGDVAAAKKLLEEGKVAADTKMSDWHDSVPLRFAAYVGHLNVAVLLLSYGANPYHNLDGKGYPLQALRNKAHTKAFAKRLDALALKASPPKESSLSERAKSILQSL